MTAEEIAGRLTDRIGDGLLETEFRGESRVYCTIDPGTVVEAADEIFNQSGGRYVITAATDDRGEHDAYLITHFFSFDDDGFYVILHARVPEDDPRIDSITPTIPGAGWGEREMQDLMGVEAVGHPDPRRLVLPDDWPEDIHPLRDDFDTQDRPPASMEGAPKMKDSPEGAVMVPVGPYFPTQHEPEAFSVYVDGEVVVDSDYRGFYNHRGIEKLGSCDLTYNQIPFIAERICGICGFVHSCAYCMAVEEAAGIEVPRRADYIRTIFLELERLHSHMLWTGVAGHIIGFDTLFMETWRMREPLMWLAEELTGNRKTYGMNIVGGVRRDIDRDDFAKIEKVLGDIEREWTALQDAVPGDATLTARLGDVGELTPEEAREFCALGPVARGSGKAIDIRVDHPYAAYDELDVKKCVNEGCDTLARTFVRLEETPVAISIIRQCLEQMPDGEIAAEITEAIPAGLQGIAAVEAPRGESFHWVLTGEENRPARWRVRAPTYANLQAIGAMIEGDVLADVPIDIGSIDPCYSCTDRMTVIDSRSGQMKVMNAEEMMSRREP
ncbi:MAG: NADH-quinone oxidoreductase subunit C [Armatimonadota bacterium]